MSYTYSWNLNLIENFISLTRNILYVYGDIKQNNVCVLHDIC